MLNKQKMPVTFICSFFYNVLYLFNPLADNKTLGLFELKAFADKYFTEAQKDQIFFDRVENIVGTGENAHYECLQKDISIRSISQVFDQLDFMDP